MAIEIIGVTNGRVRMTLRGGGGTAAERAQTALDAARRAGPVNHFAFDRRSLAEVFLTTVGRPRRRRWQMADNRTWLVALREVREATRTDSFRITLAISVVALAVIIVIANLGNDDDDPERVASSAPTPAPAAIEDIGEAIGVDVAVTTVARRRRGASGRARR